ncbi:MAG: hypothetical protein GC153_00570 [Alphaproteobacteria bacterium]|nr:hypothetical protein [Alphaproteobacteria bacterium]
MKIGVIGSGHVGGTLGKAWAHRGYDVYFAARDPRSERMRRLTRECGPNAEAGSLAGAAAFGDVILLATPWAATKQAIAAAGDLSGKIVIDATNPLKPDLSGLDAFGYASGGEAVADWAKGARVVKTMNQIGAALMDAPIAELGKPVMFVAGDDELAKEDACLLVKSLGFAAEDCGPLSMAACLEHLAFLWINRAVKQKKGATFAFVISPASPPRTE